MKESREKKERCKINRPAAPTEQWLPPHLLHGLDLSGGADSADREPDIDGWPDTLVEQLSLEEDLPVCDGDHVGGDIGRHVTSLYGMETGAI